MRLYLLLTELIKLVQIVCPSGEKAEEQSQKLTTEN